MVTGLVDNMVESAILPALEALGMSGIASLPIAKQLDPVMGIDIHFVTIPPAPLPVPMPHPYIGMLMRPKDFLAAAIATFIPPPPPPPQLDEDFSKLSDEEQQKQLNEDKAINIVHTVATMAVGMLGATVKIGGFIPRVVAGTPTKSIPHFPMGASFAPILPVQKNIGHAFMGSLFALADGDPISGGTVHMHNCCWDIGIPSVHSHRKSKNTENEGKMPFMLQLFMPTGIIMPIPMATTILTNPVPAPLNPVGLITFPAKASFGRLFNKKKRKAEADALHDMIDDRVNSGILKKMLHTSACTSTGHPVDVASGMFFTDEEDFSISGQIPLSWERKWYSKSDYQGALGYGWHHSYDMGIVVNRDVGNITLRMADGRPIAFPIPQMQTPSFIKAERLEMRVDEQGEFYLWDLDKGTFLPFHGTRLQGRADAQEHCERQRLLHSVRVRQEWLPDQNN